MFPVSITLHNPAQLNAVLAALGTSPAEDQQSSYVTVDGSPSGKTATDIGQQDTKKEVKQQTKKDAAPASEPTQTASDNSVSSSTESSATEQPTYQEVAALITKVSRTVSREAAVELLDSFGAKRGPDLKPEQFADVVAACEKALA